MKWIPCMYTHFPSLLDLSPTPPTSHPTHLCHHRAPSWASCATQGVPTSYLFYAWWCIYVSPNLSVHPGLPSPAVSTGLFCRSASLFQFIHIVMQSAPLSISRTFASFQTETPYLLNNNFPFFPPPPPGNHHSTFHLYEFDYSMDLTVISYHIRPLWLAYFTLHNVFKIHPCYGMC